MSRIAANGAWTDGILRALAGAPDGLPAPELARKACPDQRSFHQARNCCQQQLLRLERAGVIRRRGTVPACTPAGHPAVVWVLADISAIPREQIPGFGPPRSGSRHNRYEGMIMRAPDRAALPDNPARRAVSALFSGLPPEGAPLPEYRIRQMMAALAAILDFFYGEPEP